MTVEEQLAEARAEVERLKGECAAKDAAMAGWRREAKEHDAVAFENQQLRERLEAAERLKADLESVNAIGRELGYGQGELDNDLAGCLRNGFAAAESRAAAAEQRVEAVQSVLEVWLNSADASTAEAKRIRLTVREPTDAEANCITRSLLWRQCAREIEAALSAPAPAAASEWIPVSERLPADQQSVLFVVWSTNSIMEHLHGRVLGGKYLGGSWSGFSVPGLVLEASHWMPAPAPPEATHA